MINIIKFSSYLKVLLGIIISIFVFLTVNAEAWELKKKETNIKLDISLKKLDGTEITSGEAITQVLKNSNNKNIIIHFWATWCPPCIKELPQLLECYINYKDKPQRPALIMVAIDLNSKLVEKFIKKSLPIGSTLPNSILILVDRKNHLLFKSLGESVIPYSIIVNDNKVKFYNRGARDCQKNSLLPAELNS